jgi:hypothetical protein
VKFTVKTHEAPPRAIDSIRVGLRKSVDMVDGSGYRTFLLGV